MADKYNKQFLAYKTENSFNADVNNEKIDDSQSIAFVLEEGAEAVRVQGQNMKFVPSGYKDSKGLILVSDGEKPVWMMEQEIDKTSNYYGVEWGVDDSSPELTLIGKWEYCKSMPLQNSMYACIVQTNKDATTAREIYKLNPSDWDLDASIYTTTVSVKPANITLVDESEAYKGVEYKKATIVLDQSTMNNLSRWSNSSNDGYVNRFKEHWVRIGLTQSEEKLYKCFVKDVTYDESYNFTLSVLYPKDAEIKDSAETNNSIMIPGSDLTGWDGQVMVYVPGGYLHSEVVSKNGKQYNQVMVSSQQAWDADKCEAYSATYVSAFPLTTLTEQPSDYNYLSNVVTKSGISVLNENYCKGTGLSAYNNVEGLECRSQILKPIKGVTGTDYYPYFLNNLSYSMYKWLYWLMVIEYRTFRLTKPYQGSYNSIGLPLGGFGIGTTEVLYRKELAGSGAVINNGCCKSLGNGSGITAVTIPGYSNKVQYGTVQFDEQKIKDYVQIQQCTYTYGGKTIVENACTVTFTKYGSVSALSLPVKQFSDGEYNKPGWKIHITTGLLSGNVEVGGSGIRGLVVTCKSGENSVDISVPTGTGTTGEFEVGTITVGQEGLDIYFTTVPGPWDTIFTFKNTIEGGNTVSYISQVAWATKWRGIENLIAQELIYLSGISASYKSTYYEISNNGTKIGEAPIDYGYIGEYSLGNKAELIPATLSGGSTTYKAGLYYPYFNAANWYFGKTSPSSMTGVISADTGNNGVHFGMITK